jgi:hypothetical protein
VIDALLPAARAPRAPQAKPPEDPATGADTSDPGDTTAQEQALAQVKAAFDYEMALQAEMERERQALEALLIANLKDEDEVMKKWIAMIA